MMIVHEPTRQHERVVDCVMFPGVRPRGGYNSVSCTAFVKSSIVEKISIEKSSIEKSSIVKSSIAKISIVEKISIECRA